MRICRMSRRTPSATACSATTRRTAFAVRSPTSICRPTAPGCASSGDATGARTVHRALGLESGVVVAVEPTHFSAMRANGETVSIGLDGYKWAARLIDANTRGAPPTKAADVVARGDVVWLRQ